MITWSSASHSSHASTHGKSDRQLSPLPPPATIKMSPVKSEKSYHHNSSSESKLHHHIKKESTKLPAGKTPPPLPNFSLNDCSNSHPSDVSYDPNVYSARSPDPFESDASSSDVGKGTSTEPTDGNQHKNQKKKSRKHRRSQSDTEENYHTLAVSSATTITVKEEKSLSPDFSPPHLLGSGKKAVADSGVESDSSSYKQHLSPNNISVGDPLRGKKSPTITPKHHKVLSARLFLT